MQQDIRETPPKFDRPIEKRTLTIPVPKNGHVDVSVTPLFVENLPIVDSINGIRIGTNTQRKTTETVAIGEKKHSVSDEEATDYLARISTRGVYSHDRSINWMDIRSNTPESIVIQGKEYSSISTKGGDFSDPHLFVDTLIEGGFEAHGLVTESTANAMANTSNWLLAHGITSEVIWNVGRINSFPVIAKSENKDDSPLLQMLSEDEFKKYLLKEAKKRNSFMSIRDALKFGTVNDGKAKKYLDNTHFVLVQRATTVPFRMSDLVKPYSLRGADTHSHPDINQAYDESNYMYNYMIAYLNKTLSPQNRFKYLQPTSSIKDNDEHNRMLKQNLAEQAKFYEYFAKNIGKNLGNLHRNGVTHNFLHEGNITADGTFVDLDSFKGKPLGTKAINSWDIGKDVRNVLSNILVLFGNNNQPEKLGQLFISEYIKTRWKDMPKDTTTRDVNRLFRRVKLVKRFENLLLNGLLPNTRDGKDLRIIKDIQKTVIKSLA